MTTEHAGTRDSYGAGLILRPTLEEAIRVQGVFHLEHWRDGELIHDEDFENLWTTVGKNDVLDKYLGLGTANTAIHMGLKGTGAAAAGDTMASHAGWTEIAAAIVANRQVPAFSAAASGSKTTSANASFSVISGTGTTVAGAFIVLSGTSAPANTTGVLFSAGDFAASRSVNSGDTLTVGYTATLT